MEVSLSPGRLMGAFNAGVADEAWGDLPMPMLSNPRVRFWFTERGWRTYGLRVAAGARASGRAFRVVRRTKSGWSTSEAPPLTAELPGPLGASVQVSASSQLTAVAVGGHHGASHNGE
jgi:hypothetical protein